MLGERGTTQLNFSAFFHRLDTACPTKSDQVQSGFERSGCALSSIVQSGARASSNRTTCTRRTPRSFPRPRPGSGAASASPRPQGEKIPRIRQDSEIGVRVLINRAIGVRGRAARAAWQEPAPFLLPSSPHDRGSRLLKSHHVHEAHTPIVLKAPSQEERRFSQPSLAGRRDHANPAPAAYKLIGTSTQGRDAGRRVQAEKERANPDWT